MILHLKMDSSSQTTLVTDFPDPQASLDIEIFVLDKVY